VGADAGAAGPTQLGKPRQMLTYVAPVGEHDGNIKHLNICPCTTYSGPRCGRTYVKMLGARELYPALVGAIGDRPAIPQKATIKWRGVRPPSFTSAFATHKLRPDCIAATLEGATQRRERPGRGVT